MDFFNNGIFYLVHDAKHLYRVGKNITIYVHAYVCLSALYVHQTYARAHGGQMKLIPWNQLQTVLSCHMGAEHQIWFLS